MYSSQEIRDQFDSLFLYIACVHISDALEVSLGPTSIIQCTHYCLHWYRKVLLTLTCNKSLILWQADVDGDGTLDYGEFVAVSIHIRKIGNDEHLHEAFAYFDKDKSGYIEIEELRDSLADDLGPNHEEVINAIIRDVDSDKVSELTVIPSFSSLSFTPPLNMFFCWIFIKYLSFAH